jgi:hypothetical protein
MNQFYSESQQHRLDTILKIPERDSLFTEFASQRYLLLAALDFPAAPGLFDRDAVHDLPSYGVSTADRAVLADKMTDSIFAAAGVGDPVARTMLDFSGVEAGWSEPANPVTETDSDAVKFAEDFFPVEADLAPIELDEIDDSIRIIEGALAVAALIRAYSDAEYEDEEYEVADPSIWAEPEAPKVLFL